MISLAARSSRARTLRALIGGVLLWTALALARSTLHAGGGLVGRYYPNAAWSGSAVFTGAEGTPSTAQMKKRWSDAPPAAYSVRWAGYLTVGHADAYRFATTSDDGSWLYVDDHLVVDNGGTHNAATQSGEIALAAGSHRVRLDYVQSGGDAELTWSWARAGDAFTAVPAWVLSDRRVDYATAVAARVLNVGLWSLGTLIVLAVAGYGAARILLALLACLRFLWRIASPHYRSGPSLAFSMIAFGIVLFLPRADGGLFRAVVITTRDLHIHVMTALQHMRDFDAQINTPHAGERQAVSKEVLAMLAMLERHQQAEYEISDQVGDAIGTQKIVTSMWPRKREEGAKTRFLLDTEPIPQGCQPIDTEQDVSLVHCP